MKVTIKDVAKEAKVATSTVSRVLSNSPRISQDTKDRVNEAVRKLNYKPNAIARSLASKSKTRIIGVVLPEEASDILSNPFFINAMKGISECVQRKNYYITYAFSENKEKEIEHIKDITNINLVDGVILLRVDTNDKNIEYLKNVNFPFVVIGRPKDTKNTLWVDNDNFIAMENVVFNLIEKGYKRIGFIGAIKELNMSFDRLNGYKSALEKNNIKYDESIVVNKNSFNEEEGKEACKYLLEKNVDAIVTTDDLLAFGVIDEMNNKNKEIAVVGFNNNKIGEYKTPSLSSVDINSFELGYKAAKLLVDNLENTENCKTNYIINTDFIERDSTKHKNIKKTYL